ncbi:MAG: hypothetical protein DRJ05_02885 [Bacteroidetes bacterium]|nr:MAG: hypothetical protein DRJ05_02885 [Bacteroidota bacterium]
MSFENRGGNWFPETIGSQFSERAINQDHKPYLKSVRILTNQFTVGLNQLTVTRPNMDKLLIFPGKTSPERIIGPCQNIWIFLSSISKCDFLK